MSNLKTLKRRIHSIESTKKITSAMKLVASSYFKKAEKNLYAAAPHTLGLAHLLNSILKWKKVSEFSLIRGGKGSTHLCIVVSGNRGLCGGFNMNIGRRANLEINQLIKQGKKVKIICLGAKAFPNLEASFRPFVIKNLPSLNEKGAWVAISNLCEEINLWIKKGEIDTCSVVYASFCSLLLSEVKSHSLIPYEGNIMNHNRNFRKPENSPPSSLFGIEPSFGAVLRKAALSNLKSQLYFSILESQASEQSSRMIAMDGATKNSEEMLRKLKLTYNRTRQAMITNELVEIISGAESI